MPQRRSSIRGREFGDAIRALLTKAQLTNRAAAEKLGWQEAKVSDLINGKGGSSETDLALLLGVLGVTPAEYAHLMKLFRATQERDWVQPTASAPTDRSRTLREQEKNAFSITGLSMNVVHGLLQVSDYALHLAKAAVNMPDDLPAFVKLRMERQKAVLDGRRTITIYMSEHAVRLPVGDRDIMAEQRHHLLQVSLWSHVTIRLIPTAFGPHAGLAGDFDLLKFQKIPPIVYLESHGANVFLEDQPSVGLYGTVVTSLERTALDADQSRKLIIGIIDEEASRDQVAQE